MRSICLDTKCTPTCLLVPSEGRKLELSNENIRNCLVQRHRARGHGSGTGLATNNIIMWILGIEHEKLHEAPMLNFQFDSILEKPLAGLISPGTHCGGESLHRVK